MWEVVKMFVSVGLLFGLYYALDWVNRFLVSSDSDKKFLIGVLAFAAAPVIFVYLLWLVWSRKKKEDNDARLSVR